MAEIIIRNARLTADAVAKLIGDKTVVNFDVAENRRVQDASGTWTDATPTFWKITKWGNDGQSLATQLTKGKLINITGTTRTREWTDNEGAKRKSLEVVATSITVTVRGERTNGGDIEPEYDGYDETDVPPAN